MGSTRRLLMPCPSSIANLLDVHLGIDDNSEGSGAEVKKRVDEQTAAESFHAYRNVRSAAWHERRDQVAQLCESLHSSFARDADYCATQSWIVLRGKISPRSRRSSTTRSSSRWSFLRPRWRRSESYALFNLS